MEMVCDECGKNEAYIHIVQIGPNGKIEKNLCEECASGYGSTMFASPQNSMSVDDFLKGVFSNAAESGNDSRRHELVCPNCGMSYQDFQQTGKIGCSVCYGTFRRQLEPLLRRIHGTSTHSGKIPRRSGGTLELKQEIKRLRAELKEKVAQEEYEEAARLRDEVRALEQKLSAKEGGEAHV